MINLKTFIAEIGPFLGLGYVIYYFSYKDVPLEMFPSVRMFAVGLQSTEGELVQHACEQQNQVALTLSQTATQGATTRGSFRLSLSLRIVHPFLYCWCDPSQRLLTPRFQQGWDGRLENAQSASNFSPGYAPNVC